MRRGRPTLTVAWMDRQSDGIKMLGREVPMQRRSRCRQDLLFEVIAGFQVGDGADEIEDDGVEDLFADFSLGHWGS